MVVCGILCWIRARVLRPVRVKARRPVAAPWSMGIIGAALLAAAATLAVLFVSQPRAVSTTAQPPDQRESPKAPPQPLDLTIDDRGESDWTVFITGPPNARVLVSADTNPLVITALDETGCARLQIDGEKLSAGATVSAALLGPTTELAATHRSEPHNTVDSPNTPDRRAREAPVAQRARPRRGPPRAVSRTDRSSPRVVAPPNLLMVPDAGTRVAITFDGGDISRGATGLLHVLRLRGIKTTLFLTGSFIRRETALVRQAIADGHEVGNHTLDHPHLTTYATNRRHQLRPEISRASFQHQLTATERLLRDRVGSPMVPLWRAPYGEENATLRGWAYELGYLHARWSSVQGHSLDAWDWVADEHSSIYEEPDTMVQRLLAFPRLNGGIVLMHLGSHRQTPSWTALPKLLDELDRRGFEIVPLTDLLSSSPTWSERLASARTRHQATFSGPTGLRADGSLPADQAPRTSRTDPNQPTSPSSLRGE